MKLGSMKILEPEGEPTSIVPDLVIVPAVAVDKDSHRLGRGGGFYDEFLSTFTGPTIAVVPSFAIVEKLPTEGHDKKIKERGAINKNYD